MQLFDDVYFMGQSFAIIFLIVYVFCLLFLFIVTPPIVCLKCVNIWASSSAYIQFEYEAKNLFEFMETKSANRSYYQI